MKGRTNLPDYDLEKTVLTALQDRNIQLTGIQRLGGGRNSRVLLLEAHDQSFVLKTYPKYQDDPRDRLGTEVTFLSFLHQYGISQVPKPLFWSEQQNWATFSRLNGSEIKTITTELLDGVAHFLGHLKALGLNSGSCNLPLASDACFNFIDLQLLLSHRFDRLSVIQGRGHLHSDAYSWCCQCLKTDLLELSEQQKTLTDSETPLKERVLSPSDVGIHNMLRSDDGFCFLDFEYAGWDDPSKFLSDWILQPDNPLPLDQALYLVNAVKAQIGEGLWLKKLPLALDFYRLKWCAIMLNPFLRDYHNAAEHVLSKQLHRTQSYFKRSKLLVSMFSEAFTNG